MPIYLGEEDHVGGMATETLTTEALDELLSEAQRVLRDGHNDRYSAAVAEARNRFTLPRSGPSEPTEMHIRRGRSFLHAGGLVGDGGVHRITSIVQGTVYYAPTDSSGKVEPGAVRHTCALDVFPKRVARWLD